MYLLLLRVAACVVDQLCLPAASRLPATTISCEYSMVLKSPVERAWASAADGQVQPPASSEHAQALETHKAEATEGLTDLQVALDAHNG